MVLSGCQGGWATLQAMEGLPIGFLKPAAGLATSAANGSDAAKRIIELMADNAADADRELVAPSLAAGDATLAGLGFSYLERTEPVRLEEALSG